MNCACHGGKQSGADALCVVALRRSRQRGILTGNRQQQDITFVAPERQEAWRYKIGVMSLCDGVERFYWPRMVLQARPEDLPDSGGIPS